MIGVDEHIVGAAGHLEVAFRLQLRGGLVVNRLVGAENVIAVMDDDIAGEGQDIVRPGLAVGVPLDGHADRGRGLGLGDGQNLLAGIVGKRRGKLGVGIVRAGRDWSGRGGAGGGLRRRRQRIGRRLPPKLQVTEGQQREKHEATRTHPRTKAQHNKSGLLWMGRGPRCSGSKEQLD